MNVKMLWWVLAQVTQWESACNARDTISIPELGRSPWRRKWQLTLVFLPGESHGQRSLAGYSPWGHKELDTTEWLSTHSQVLNQSPIMRLDWDPTSYCGGFVSCCRVRRSSRGRSFKERIFLQGHSQRWAKHGSEARQTWAQPTSEPCPFTLLNLSDPPVPSWGVVRWPHW